MSRGESGRVCWQTIPDGRMLMISICCYNEYLIYFYTCMYMLSKRWDRFSPSDKSQKSLGAEILNCEYGSHDQDVSVPRESWHEWKKKRGLKNSFQNETLFMLSLSMSATKAFLSLNQHCRSQLATLIDFPLDDLSANDVARLRNKPHRVFLTKLTRAWNLRWKCSSWCIIFNQWCTLKIRALS